MTTQPDITMLLGQLKEGDPQSFDKLVPLVYEQLRTIAQRYLAGNRGNTLDTTALVHEAYMKLANADDQDYDNRDQFMRICSVVMRNLVIDFARKRTAAKRGGHANPLTFEEDKFAIDSQAEELLALNQAMDKLSEYDPKLTRIVECKYFAGLTDLETAQALEMSERSVRRGWVKARSLLHQILKDDS